MRKVSPITPIRSAGGQKGSSYISSRRPLLQCCLDRRECSGELGSDALEHGNNGDGDAGGDKTLLTGLVSQKILDPE